MYYIIPMAALVATLVTIGLLTKNSELIVMRACGISLYRSALPLLLFAILFSGALFELQEQVLADSNREAERLNAIIRGYPTQTFGILNRQWIIGRSGDIYHYEFFDPQRQPVQPAVDVPPEREQLEARLADLRQGRGAA